MGEDKTTAKSKIENKKKIYSREMHQQAVAYAGMVMIVLAALISIIQLLITGDTDQALYALVLSGLTTTFWVRFIKLKEKKICFLALLGTCVTLVAWGLHLYDLISPSVM